jgi:hypothetical protein
MILCCPAFLKQFVTPLSDQKFLHVEASRICEWQHHEETETEIVMALVGGK